MRTSKVQDSRCLVCKGEVKPPALHFCSAKCGEAWVAKAREREPALMPKTKA